MPTKIEWTEETWNPVTGCTPVSEGCQFCYAKRIAKRFGGDFSKVTLHPDRLEIPLHWRKPRTVFVCSMGDLFHEDVSDEFIGAVFRLMVLAKRHTFQVLTKRPGRMQDFIRSWLMGLRDHTFKKVLPNVWLGVSVENQARADERIPLLLGTPAAVRFVSCEPLLSGLDLRLRDTLRCHCGEIKMNCDCPGLDWAIVGAESGPRARPMEEEWARGIKSQCVAAGVSFFYKQQMENGRKVSMPKLDGQVWDQMPDRESMTK